MRAQLFTIGRAGPGWLSTMARPRGGAWLDDELAALVTAGVGVLVSLLSDAELGELELDREAELAVVHGLEFHRLATPDLQVPDRAATLELAAVVRDRLAAGAGVAVHCWAGIGRSSTLAAAVLVLEGVEPAEAWRLISVARGLRVPDTDAQREFVHTLLTSPTGP
jgi:protein-tyrosine phosphatase